MEDDTAPVEYKLLDETKLAASKGVMTFAYKSTGDAFTLTFPRKDFASADVDGVTNPWHTTGKLMDTAANAENR